MSNTWTTVKTKAPAGGYVPPSQRKAPEPTFDMMFPEGLIPVAQVKKTVWASNFKAAIEKKDDVVEPVKDTGILASYTNPRTGKTTIVRDMPHHPYDNLIEEAVIVPNVSSFMKKAAAKRLVLDDDDDSFVHAETGSYEEEEHYDHHYSEEEEEDTADDYVSE